MADIYSSFTYSTLRRVVPMALAAVLTLIFSASPCRALAPTVFGPTVFGPTAGPVASPPVLYRLPVRGPIIDPFRAPVGPYGAGNRGVEIGTVPGTAVASAADGDVTFAGPVGGDLFVVVSHSDGVRTTYGFLATISVSAGAVVHLGDAVGTARSSVHWGARHGDSYFDPMTLLSAGTVKVRLVKGRGSAI